MPVTKQYVEEIFDGISQGNPTLLLNAIDDNVRWRIGSIKKDPRRITGIYTKAEWHDAVNVGLRSKLKDGHIDLKVLDLNVVESKGLAILEIASTATQNNGNPYDNLYAWFLVFDEKGEKIVEVREYLDTALVEEVSTTN